MRDSMGMYRGQRLHKKEWVYGSLIIVNDRTFIAQTDNCYPCSDAFVSKEVDPETVGRFVYEGIYEGDTCDVWHEDDVYMDEEGEDVVHKDNIRKCVVRWGGPDYPAFDLMMRSKGYKGKMFWEPCDDEHNTFSNDSWKLQVTGNIHDKEEQK